MSETPKAAAAEARLARFFREDGLADHDATFTVMLAQRQAEKHLRRNLIALGGLSVLAAAVLWALSPWLIAVAGRFAERMELLGPAAVVLIVVASVLVVVGLPMAPSHPDEGLAERPPA